MNWLFDEASIDWDELASLYRIAPLGDKSPKDLRLLEQPVQMPRV